jgi:hypothetical protein
MADNTAQARKSVDGHRRAIQDHIGKYKRYTQDYEKRGALRTIEGAQGHIRSLRNDHPSIGSSWEDTWRP